MIKRKHRTNPIPIIVFFIILSLTLYGIYDTFYNKDNSGNNNTNNNNTNNNNSYNVNTNDNKYENNDTSNNDNLNNADKFVKATVKRVVDGDTIIVTIDNDEQYRLRLIGINCPEYTSKIEAYGKEATEYTTKMLNGKTVYLEKDVSETDKYNRLLRYVWLDIPNRFSEDEIKKKMFNAILVINGYAQVATYPPDVKYANYFKTFTDIARKNNVGLWKIK